MPERQPGRAAGRRHHHHTVMGDVLDLPGGGAQRDDVADAGLVDHLLVELTDAARPLARLLLRQDHRVQSAVRYRAAGGDGQPLRPRPCGDQMLLMIPHQAGPEGRECLRIIGAGQHAEHRVEHGTVQVGERGGSAHHLIPVVGVQVLHGRGGHRLLGEYVQRAARYVERLDGTAFHAFHSGRRADDLLARQRIEQRMRDAAHLVVGATHALQSGGYRQRRGHLDDQIHAAHIDAELQAAGGHHATQSALLEILLDAFAAVLGHRTVVGHGDRVLRRVRMDEVRGRPRHGIEMPLAGVRFIRPRFLLAAVTGHGGVQVVEPCGEPFRQTT